MTTKGIIATVKEHISFPAYIHRLKHNRILVESKAIDQVEAVMQKHPQFGKELTDRGLIISLDGDGSGCPKCHYGELDITFKIKIPGYLDSKSSTITAGLLTFERDTTVQCKVCGIKIDMPINRYPTL